MTELAYLADMEAAYVTRFTARVTALPPGGVVLDRTFFYPTGGGQSADAGTLASADGHSARVIDVTKSGPAVVHRIARGGDFRPEVGSELRGEIDWARRHRHMRLHTAQHLLSALIFAQCRQRTRRATMAGRGGVIDLEGSWPAEPTVASVGTLLREWVRRRAPVTVRHVARDDWEHAPAARSGLVPLPPQVDPVRVIEIEGIDACPCGGTHVRSTAEIGAIELGTVVPGPGGTDRITFTLDERAPPTPSA